jgi:hypothetical protein
MSDTNIPPYLAEPEIDRGSKAVADAWNQLNIRSNILPCLTELTIGSGSKAQPVTQMLVEICCWQIFEFAPLLMCMLVQFDTTETFHIDTYHPTPCTLFSGGTAPCTLVEGDLQHT